MRQTTAFLIGACVLFTVNSYCTAQQPADAQADQPSTKPAEEKELIQLNFPQNLEVKVLVDYVSKRLGMNILYDEAIVKKRVTISAPAKIPKDSLYGLFESVLKMAGLMLIDDDQPGWKRIVENKNLLDLTNTFEEGKETLAGAKDTQAITQIFELKHITPQEAENVIKPFQSKPGGNSFSIPDRNLIIISDYASQLRRMDSLIKLVDVPGEKASIRFVAVENVDAADLAGRVTALLKEKESVGSNKGPKTTGKLTLTSEPRTNQIVVISTPGADAEALRLIAALDVPSGNETHTYRLRYISPRRIDKITRDLAGVQKTTSQYTSVIDEESGMLIVTAPQRLHERIESLVKELDTAEADSETSNVRFYKLMNTTASNVLATIKALDIGEKELTGLNPEAAAGKENKDKQPSEFTGPNTPPPAAGEPLPKPPSYTPDKKPKESTADKPADSAGGVTTSRTKDAIVTIDTNTNTLIVVAPPSVQKVYKQLISILDKRRPQVMIEVKIVTLDTSDNFSLGVDLLRKGSISAIGGRYLIFSSFGVSTADTTAGSLAITPGTGFNASLIAPDWFDIVIRALESSGRTKVVSAPRVLVNDNSTATLSSVQQSPFTSVNASDTVSTTSFAGYASAGTTITVTPTISEGDHLQMNYSVTLSSFDGEGSGGIPPPRQEATVNSDVTIPDGYTVIVGGLKRQDFSDSYSGVPFLGRVPVLKYLVGSASKTNSDSTLFVFIRPIILRDDQFTDLKYLSDKDLELAELPPNFPGSEPLIMR